MDHKQECLSQNNDECHGMKTVKLSIDIESMTGLDEATWLSRRR